MLRERAIMVEMTFVDSTNIEAVGYDSSAQELHIKFLKTGITYVYYSVEEWRFDELMRSDSKGRYVNLEIKPNYQCAQL